MRKIKFRAWDKLRKEMISFRELMLSLSINSIADDDERYVLMQFTGMKDKNGYEIFEGDIIYYDGYLYRVIYSNRDAMFIMVGDYTTEHFGNVSESSVDVMGNVYENKDLIKDIIIG